MHAQQTILREARQIDTSRAPLLESDEQNAARSETESKNLTLEVSSKLRSLAHLAVDYPGPALLIGTGLALFLVEKERSRATALASHLAERSVAAKQQIQSSFDHHPTAMALGAGALVLGFSVGLLMLPQSTKIRENLGEATSGAASAAKEILDRAKSTIRDRLDLEPVDVDGIRMGSHS